MSTKQTTKPIVTTARKNARQARAEARELQKARERQAHIAELMRNAGDSTIHHQAVDLIDHQVVAVNETNFFTIGGRTRLERLASELFTAYSSQESNVVPDPSHGDEVNADGVDAVPLIAVPPPVDVVSLIARRAIDHAAAFFEQLQDYHQEQKDKKKDEKLSEEMLEGEDDSLPNSYIPITRRQGESIVVGEGDDSIEIRVVRTSRRESRLAVRAPQNKLVIRKEDKPVLDAVSEEVASDEITSENVCDVDTDNQQEAGDG